MKGSSFSRFLIVVPLIILTILSSGCVRVIGEVSVDWRAHVELGIKSLMSPTVYRAVKPTLVEPLKNIDGIHIEEIEENGQRGFRWRSSLEEVKPQLEKLSAILPTKKDAITVDIHDYWLFKAIDVNARVDLSDYHIPKYLTFLFKPSFELSMPIRTKNNADQVEGNRLIWKLSLTKPNHIWIHVWVPNLINLLIVLIFLVASVTGFIFMKRRSRVK